LKSIEAIERLMFTLWFSCSFPKRSIVYIKAFESIQIKNETKLCERDTFGVSCAHEPEELKQ
jgi:hypothetical protein